MAIDERDEALSWAGDAEAGLVGFDPDAQKPAQTTPNKAVIDEHKQPAASGASLVFTGLFGGIYLLYVIGWAIFVFSHPIVHTGAVLPAVMYELGEALAIVSPLFWFFAVFVVLRGDRAKWRMLWLIIGAIVLVPWAFILSAVIGS